VIGLVAALLAATPALQLRDAAGAAHSLSDYRGKVVLLNFWATWCDPCIEELPALERLRASLEGKPFVILGVQMRGSARTAQDTADELKLRFPLLLDRDSKASAAWGVDILPTTVLIGRDGQIKQRHVGEWSESEVRRAVEALLR
jgi:peroxiredoxin